MIKNKCNLLSFWRALFSLFRTLKDKSKFSILLNLLLPIFCLINFSSANADSEKSTNPSNNHSYQRVDMPKTWSQAKEACSSQGGYLTSITSQAENDWVMSNLVSPQNLIDGAYWMGGTDSITEGTWTWVSGEPWSYSNRGNSNSNFADNAWNGQNYLRLLWNGFWDDDGLPTDDAASSYICEWNSTTDNQNTNVDLSTGLVAHWSFDDCSAKDNSGNGHDGTLNGDPQCVENGNANAAYNFSGSSFIDVSNSSSPNIAGAIAISFWMKPANPGGWNNYYSFGIVSKKATDGQPGYVIYDDGNYASQLNFRMEGTQGSALYLHSNAAVDLGVWQHWVVTYDPVMQIARLYKNGSLDIEYSNIIIGDMTSTTPLQIGHSQAWNGFFDGLLDEVMIYNRALTEAEVTALYQQGAAPTYCSLMESADSLDKNSIRALTELVAVDGSLAVTFPTIDTISAYKALTKAQTTASALTKQIELLKKQSNQLTSQTYGRVSKSNATYQNIQKAKQFSQKINLLSRDKALAKAEYDNIVLEMKTKRSPLAHAGAALNLYSFAVSLSDLYEDGQNIAEGKDLLYDWTKAAFDTTGLVGSGLGLYEYIAAVKPNFISSGLSKTAAPLFVAEAVSQAYEWERDSTIFEQLQNIMSTYNSTTELRYFHVDQIVDLLITFDPETQTIDELRGSIVSALDHYPKVERSDGSLFIASQEFLNYLNNTKFLNANFKKSFYILSYAQLTPPELAEVAAVYVLGEAATLENNKLQKTSIDNLTKPPTLSDFIAGGFGGKDSYKIFKNVRSVILDTVTNDNVYKNLLDRFDSVFFKRQHAIMQQIGENIHYYECP